MSPYEFSLRAVGDHDVLIDVLYAGVCHSDIHAINEDWGPMGEFPMVPGHEVVGRVAATGKNASRFKVGDLVGVGGVLDSCGECKFCRANLEQFCLKGPTFTDSGYADKIVANERFVLSIPDGMPVEQAAPLMCAGITAYSPLKKLNIQKDDKVAVAGLGGVGHMALKFAASMGAEVTVFEITDAKADIAKKLGATHYVNTRANPKALEQLQGQFHAIVSTIPVRYDIQPYIDALESAGTLVILGMPATAQSAATFDLNTLSGGARSIMGSQVGGIRETQEMLDYAAKQKIYPEVEIITADRINEAFQRVLDGDVQFRFVIDMSTAQ